MNFSTHLTKQLGFLRRSCDSYDQGFTDEAVRIATVVRVLLHQTRNCTSLLKHLNATTINLLSTVEGATPNTVYLMGMGIFCMHGNGQVIYRPHLGDCPFTQMIPVSKWWDAVVMVTGGRRISRKQIVLGAATQDGGAHVDSKLNADYEALTQHGAAGAVSYVAGGNSKATLLEGAHLVSSRQIGYELLNSTELLARAN